MTEDVNATRHPAPQAGRVAPHESFFALFGGPLAWFAQLCFGFALSSQPCFVDGDRSWRPSPGSQWALPAMWSAMGVAILIALAALFISWRVYRGTASDAPGDRRRLIEVGAGRTRFLALWGVVLAAGFAVVTAFTAVAFPFISRCSG